MPAEATPWEAGRLDGGGGPRAVLFGRMYEDPAIELEAFAPGGRVLCIASAGCTARRLAGRHEVVAVDVNPVQLAYARRRLAGEAPQTGSAERVMAALRALLPLAGVRRRDLEGFLQLAELGEQAERWRRLCTGRFRLGLEALFSLSGLRLAYASPLLAALPRRFGRVLLARLQRGFSLHPNAANPYARALFLGEPDGDDIGPAPGPVELVCADVASYLEGQAPRTFTGVTLSNVLDGADTAYRARLAVAVRRAVAPDGVVVLRSFAEPTTPEAAAAAARDRALLWGAVQLGPPAAFA